jgi:hypothetical protein
MKRWETWARLDLGDHGMGAQRDDPQRVGFIELTDALRWVPREGEDWSVPISSLTVRTPRRRFVPPSDGVELAVPELGVIRIRALAQRPGTAVPRQTAYQGQSGRSAKLLKELLKRGASYDPRG